MEYLTEVLMPNKVYHVGIHKAYNPYKKIFEKVID